MSPRRSTTRRARDKSGSGVLGRSTWFRPSRFILSYRRSSNPHLLAALLEAVEREGHCLAPDHADHHAILTAWDVAAHRLVVVEVVVHDRLALGAAHEPAPQAEQPSRGDHELKMGIGALHVHLRQ